MRAWARCCGSSAGWSATAGGAGRTRSATRCGRASVAARSVTGEPAADDAGPRRRDRFFGGSDDLLVLSPTGAGPAPVARRLTWAVGAWAALGGPYNVSYQLPFPPPGRYDLPDDAPAG